MSLLALTASDCDGPAAGTKLADVRTAVNDS